MVPAGLGVFETTLLLLNNFYYNFELLSALPLYRLFFNLAPFALALCLLFFDAMRRRTVTLKGRGRTR